MRFVALAADFDGTLATDSAIDAATIGGLERLRASGRALIMVTGRELPDLKHACPALALFSLVVAENGAMLYWPETDRVRMLAEAPPRALLEALRTTGVAPLSVGNAIVATWHPHENAVLDVIRRLGLEHQVIFNKGAVMILPPGVNKASGLIAGLHELGLSPHNVVGVGDAENDHSFLSICECSVAVKNALPTLKKRADVLTTNARGAGVVELIDELVASDLRGREPLLRRHDIPLGTRPDGESISLPSHDLVILVAGPPMSGKSTLTLGLMERLTERGHQICVVDPEGDYESFGEVKVEVRRMRQASSRVVELLELPERNVCVDLLGLSMAERPGFGADLLAGIATLQHATARPHWLVLDEAHHLFPFDATTLPEYPPGLVLVTVDLATVSQSILDRVDVVITTGETAGETMRAFYRAVDEPLAPILPSNLTWGECLVSIRQSNEPPFPVRIVPTRTRHRRHRRKYDLGDVGPGRGFYFRGPDDDRTDYAPNLSRFAELALLVDDDVWLFHLHRGDYERWFREVARDDELACETARIATTAGSPDESRLQLRTAIIERYAGPN
jgi:HAD superfamily hydrolase (TIGR01484 family)